MRFFTGCPHPHTAHRLALAMVSINALARRKSDFVVGEWIMDSGAFTQVTTHGKFQMSEAEYADAIIRWSRCGTLLAAVSQDWMCEPFARAKTGASVADHQRWTIERYDRIRELVAGRVYVMPVLQGWVPDDYADHVRQYGDRLAHGAWVGVGSVCKRQSRPGAIAAVLDAIHAVRPDLRLHGFGVKVSSLGDGRVREQLHSADSMAWSYAARYEGRKSNDIREAIAYEQRVNTMEWQMDLDV